MERSARVNTGSAIRGLGNVLGPIDGGGIAFTLDAEAGTPLEVVEQGVDGGKFFDEIFQNGPQDFLGSVKVHSDTPFYLVVLRRELIPGEQLRFRLTSSVPATPVP